MNANSCKLKIYKPENIPIKQGYDYPDRVEFGEKRVLFSKFEQIGADKTHHENEVPMTRTKTI